MEWRKVGAILLSYLAALGLLIAGSIPAIWLYYLLPEPLGWLTLCMIEAFVVILILVVVEFISRWAKRKGVKT